MTPPRFAVGARLRLRLDELTPQSARRFYGRDVFRVEHVDADRRVYALRRRHHGRWAGATMIDGVDYVDRLFVDMTAVDAVVDASSIGSPT